MPGDARLVLVTKGTDAESPGSVRKLSPGITVPLVMSSDAWDAYDVPVAPFFVLIDGVSGNVLGEGAASNWDQVSSMLQQALEDAGLVDGKGRRKGGSSVKFRSDAVREEPPTATSWPRASVRVIPASTRKPSKTSIRTGGRR